MEEDPIAELFEQVAVQLRPAVDRIVDEAERRGRRLRTRRRTRVALGNMLAIAAVVGTGLAVGMHGGHAAVPTALADASGTAPRAGSASATAETTPTARTTPSASRAPVSKTPTSAASAGEISPQMLDTLRSLLPAGSRLTHVRTIPGPGKSLQVDYDDGHGAVDMILWVSPTSHDDVLACPNPPWTDEGPRPAGALPISCTQRTPPGGGLECDAVSYADSFGFYGYVIYDQRPDGLTVSIQVANGINHGLPQVDRATPPGTMQQWATVVESPAWRL